MILINIDGMLCLPKYIYMLKCKKKRKIIINTIKKTKKYSRFKFS